MVHDLVEAAADLSKVIEVDLKVLLAETKGVVSASTAALTTRVRKALKGMGGPTTHTPPTSASTSPLASGVPSESAHPNGARVWPLLLVGWPALVVYFVMEACGRGAW